MSVRQRSVQFQSIEIIELAYAIGDNPCVSGGVPLTCEWNAQRRCTIGLDYFEKHRPARSEQVVRFNPKFRAKLLLRSGYTEAEIKQAAIETEKAKMERFKTMAKVKKMMGASKNHTKESPTRSGPILGNVLPKIRTARSA